MANGYDGYVKVNTQVDTKNFNKSIDGMMAGLGKIAKAAGIAFSVGAIVKFGKECMELSSDLTEVDNVVEKAFEGMRGEMDELANTAIKTLGMSRLTAYQTGSTFMAMGKSMLDSSEDAKTMALELTKLTGNMASFYNKSQDLVSLALKSVYTGETETLKQYGIVMTEVNLKQFAMEQGIKKAYNQMSQSEKVMLRYNYVMQQTAFIGEDFADTQDTWANQTRILKEQWKEFMLVLGNGLVTVLTPVVKGLNSIISALITFANAVGTIMSKIFGIKGQTMSVASAANDTASAYSDAADSANDYGEATENAGKASKKAGKEAKKATANFDDLNQISNPSSSDSGGGSGSGGGAGGGSIDMSPITTGTSILDEAAAKWEEQIGKIKSLWEELASIATINFKLTWEDLDVSSQLENIKGNIASIGTSLSNIFTNADVQNAAHIYVDSLAGAFGTITASIISIGATIGEAVTGGIAMYLEENQSRITNGIVKFFEVGTELNGAVANLWKTFAELFQVFGQSEMQGIIASLIQIIVDVIGGGLILVTEIATDLAEAITKPISDNMEPLKTMISGTLGFIGGLLEVAAQFVRDFVDGIVDLYESHISPFIKNITAGVSLIVGSILESWNSNIQPVLNKVGTDVKKLYDSYIKPIMKNVLSIIGDVIDIIGELWKNAISPLIAWLSSKFLQIVKPILENLWSVIGGENGAVTKILKIVKSVTDIVSEVTGLVAAIIKGDWKKAWKSAQNIVKNVVNGMIGLFEGMVNKAIDAINLLLAPLRTIVKLGATAMNAIFGTSFSVPDDFKHVKIPKLAQGGVIPPNAPFLAMLGDQKSGTNIETPLDTMILAFKTALQDADMGGRGNATVVLEVDKREFGRAAVRFGNQERQRVGISLVE